MAFFLGGSLWPSSRGPAYGLLPGGPAYGILPGGQLMALFPKGQPKELGDTKVVSISLHGSQCETCPNLDYRKNIVFNDD
jgi:hypothetical protein